MSTVSNAVAQRVNSGTQLIEQYRNVFAEVLPSHVKPETWLRVAQGALRRNNDLANAAASNPQSLVSALLEAARLGLEPGTEQFYLVPMKGEVNGWTGYQGEIELIYRAGAVSSVIAEVVHQKDGFQYQPGMDRPVHEIDWDLEDRGDLRLVYAYAQMKDGSTSRVVVMNKAVIMRHKAMSMGSERADSPWKKWPESMWLKTAVHELQKWVPTSAEYLRDQARAAGEMIRHASRPVSPAGPRPPQPASAPERADEPVRVPATTDNNVVDGAVVATGEPTDRLITEAQMRAVHAGFRKLELTDDVGKHAYATEKLNRPVESFKSLTTREASALIDILMAEAGAVPVAS